MIQALKEGNGKYNLWQRQLKAGWRGLILLLKSGGCSNPDCQEEVATQDGIMCGPEMWLQTNQKKKWYWQEQRFYTTVKVNGWQVCRQGGLTRNRCAWKVKPELETTPIHIETGTGEQWGKGHCGHGYSNENCVERWKHFSTEGVGDEVRREMHMRKYITTKWTNQLLWSAELHCSKQRGTRPWANTHIKPLLLWHVPVSDC